MRKSLPLTLLATAAYAASIFLIRGLLIGSFRSTLVLLVIPLAILAALVSWDLITRAKVPSPLQPKQQQLPSLSHEVQKMTKRIDVGRRSSSDFYNKVLLNRLRDAFIEKASVETGLSTDEVRRIITNHQRGKSFVGNQDLYDLLYVQRPPKTGERRLEMIERLANLIEEWDA